ncbi:type I methionyl aminopeptidase [Maribellus maritimus]|uniref:type I methionyl aminopeptidase n=1 Tax=Maribellus maritimus TaxID=2870838 RepID=UPI001EEC5295|nr:type I methionyl aminopeptidase [Maribellus maritimus]MCG6186966.1 type I methionyl aminopeptidase [Maribellus maritimus]
MIYLKTKEEIKLIRESSLLVSKTLALVASKIRPGVSTLELDRVAETFIRNNDGVPAFKGFEGFPNTLCVSVNDVVVHGIPSDYKIKDGDIVSVDCGVLKNGFYGDSCYTFEIGDVSEQKKLLCKIAKEALTLGIEKAVEGNRLGTLGNVIQNHVEEYGFSVVRELNGHGIGRDLHEEPEVRNYGKPWRGEKLHSGMVIAIEPMVNAGSRKIYQMEDGWTVKTIDGKPAAHFEHTVLVREDKAEVLSTFEIIEEQIEKNNFLWQNSLL